MSEEPETTADFPQGEPPSDPLAETAPGAEESRSWLQQDSPLDRDDWIGTRVGQYEIIGLIGSGGMGGVYEARQQHPHRTVAIKIIKSTVMSPSVLRRFELEGEVLGRLQHPGIARILEAGTASHDGADVPYFVMELISGGQSLTDYANTHEFDRQHRLELMLRVCDAVQFGHSRGIIHRDIKPSNVIVAADGQPKVIDWGVALPINIDMQVTTSIAEEQRFVGTLQWTSPEQCGDDPHDVDVRTDVYSLGVLLYQLLLDRLPYVLRGMPVYKAPQVIREQPPVPPHDMDPEFPTDLEQIVLKALAKERLERYDSVAAFANDIRRYMDHRPVLAQPASRWHRLRLYARRNTVVFRLSVLAAAAVLLGVAGLAWGLLEAEARRQETETALAETESARLVAEQRAYAATLGAAQAAIAGEAWDSARAHLAGTEKADRGWEWRHLQAQVDQSYRQWLIGDRPTALAANGPNHIAVAFDGGRLAILDNLGASIRDVMLPARVQAMAWSADGEALFIGTTTGQIAEILPTSGGMTTLVENGPSVESIIMLPDGFATGHSDRVVRLWSTDGALVRSLPDQGGLVQALAVDPAGQLLAIGGGDGSVRVMPLQGDALPQVIGRHGSAVRTLHFVSGDLLASGGGDDVVRLWDVAESEQVAVATGHTGDILALTVAGAFIASAGEDGDIRIWSSQDLSPVDVLRGHGDLAWSITAVDDRQVLSLGRDGMLRWWVASPPPPESVRMGGRLPATAMAFIDPWHLVATSELDTGIREFNLATGTVRDHRVEGIHELTAIVAANHGRVATGDTAGTIKVWGLDFEAPPTTIGSHTAQVSAMAIAPDSTTLVSGSYDGTVTLWDLATDLRGIELPKQDAIVLDVAVDEQKIYTATSGDRVSAWNRSDGGEAWQYNGHEGDVQVITLIPEQELLVTSALNGALHLLDIETGEVVAALTNPGGAVREIVAMPGGRRFMTISGDGTMTFWDTLLPGVVASLHAPQALECAVLSPDGTMLAVGGEQPTIHLLDAMRRGERLAASGNAEQ